MDHVKDNGNGQHGAGHPVVSHPIKLDTYLRKEGGEQQREHGGCHDPMKQTRSQRVSRYTLGQERRECGRSTARKLLTSGEIAYVDGVNDEEEQPRDRRNPY